MGRSFTFNPLSGQFDLISEVTIGTANGLSITAAQALSLALSSTSTTGALSSTDWNTFNGKQAAGNYITALTGDVTATGPGSVAATLATVNGNVGSFGSSTSIPNFTVNAKGLITAAGGNVVIAPAGTLTGTTLNATVVSSSLTSVGTITTGTWNGTTIAIANGGTGQTSKAAAFDALSPMTSVGDIIYGGTAGTGTRLAAGSNTNVLTLAGGVPTWAAPTTGSVTSVSVVSANGLAGTVATATTTPAITLSTTVTGILSGNGTAISAASTTGSGAVVLATSPTLVTPALGTPTAIVLSSGTGLPLTTGVTGTLPIGNGGTGQTSSTTAFNALSPLTTKGDLVAFDGTNNVRQAAGTNGTFLKADSTAANGFTWTSTISTSAYRSVTTTDSPTTADDILALSGASFTVTLFTAVGNTGKVLTFINNGTSLTQIYTFNTTSAQTIGGVASGSYILTTNGERLRIVSDGANWQIIEHDAITPWVSYTPTFTGFGTVTVQAFVWRRVGDSVEISGKFTLGTTTATEARLSLPGGITSDTAKIPAIKAVGYYLRGGTAVAAHGGGCAMEPTVAYITFYSEDAYGNASVDVLVKENGSTLGSSGQVLSISNIIVPISNWQP